MGPKQSQIPPPSSSQKEILTYEKIEDYVCSGLEISKKQLQSVIWSHFYPKFQRESVLPQVGQSQIFQTYPTFSSLQRRGGAKDQNNQLYQLLKKLNDQMNSIRSSKQEQLIVDNQIMQSELKNQSSVLYKPTSQSESKLLSNVIASFIDIESPYEKCYRQLMHFLQDFLQYRYQSDFVGEVTKICKQNAEMLARSSSSYHDCRPSKNDYEDKNESQVLLFERIMNKFLAIIERISKRVQVEIVKIAEFGLQNQNKCKKLEMDLQLQHSVLQAYQKNVLKKLHIKQFQHQNKIKQLQEIIHRYQSSKCIHKICSNFDTEIIPELQSANMRKFSDGSNLKIMDSESNEEDRRRVSIEYGQKISSMLKIEGEIEAISCTGHTGNCMVCCEEQ